MIQVYVLKSSKHWLRLFLDGALIDSVSFTPECYYEYWKAREEILTRNGLHCDGKIINNKIWVWGD